MFINLSKHVYNAMGFKCLYKYSKECNNMLCGAVFTVLDTALFTVH